MLVRGGGRAGPREGDSRHAAQAVGDERVGLPLDPLGDVGVGRSSGRRIVLEAPEARGIVRWRDDDAIGQALPAAPVVGEHRMRDHRGRRVATVRVDHDVDPVGRQHLQRAGEGRLRERVGIDANEEGPVDALLLAIEADGLGHGQDVRLVEGVVERGPAMPGGAEHHALRGHGGIRSLRVVGGDQPRHVDEDGRIGGLSGEWTDGHSRRSSAAGDGTQAIRSGTLWHSRSGMRTPRWCGRWRTSRRRPR